MFNIENSIRGKTIKEEIAHLERRHDNSLSTINRTMQLYKDLRSGVNTKGSITSVLEGLGKPFLYMSLLASLRDGDPDSFRRNSFAVAAYNRLKDQELSPHGSYSHQLLTALLSNHPAMIHWYKQFLIPFFARHNTRKPIAGFNPKSYGMLQLVWLLALQGNWPVLKDLAEFALSSGPKLKKIYMTDYEFGLALAEGNKTAMEDCIADIIKQNRWRDDISVFYVPFVSVYGVLYTKIAAIHGYQLDVDEKWIPPEWIDLTPAVEYSVPEIIQNDFDLFKPLPYTGPTVHGAFQVDYSPVSPIAASEGMITFEDIWGLLEGKPYNGITVK